MITVRHKGNFNFIEKFFNRVLKRDYLNILSEYADRGVQALREATPTESGKTAASWNYEIINEQHKTTLYFTNSNTTSDGTSVAILLLYGHGTRNGGYVEGIDFVSPALKPIFEELADSMWREVTE